MVLLRWFYSWFLISEETFKVHQKDIMNSAMHSSCLKALHDRGCLRLKQVLSGEFKATSPPPDFLPHPSLAGAWGECFHWLIGLKHYKNLTWQAYGRHDECTDCHSKSKGQYHTFAAHSPPPPRDWYGGPFPTRDGELAQELSLTMRPTRTASSLCLFSPQWLETWLTPGSCSDIRAGFEVCI